jgi:hypothetical protein
VGACQIFFGSENLGGALRADPGSRFESRRSVVLHPFSA